MNALATRVKSSRRASAITFALVIVVLAAAAWFGVVGPKRSDASNLKTQVADQQAKLADATQAAAVANRKAAESALLALPSDPDQPGILDELNKYGKQTGVLVAGVTPNLTTLTPNAVTLAVTVQGKYFQIRDFLHKLRTTVRVGKGGRVVASGRLFDVSSVNIAQGTATAGNLSASLSVTASIYGPTSSTPTTTTTTPAASAASASTGSAN